MPLELHQSFVKNTDGSYSRFQCPEPQIEPEGNRSDRPQAIRPMELRTFLKVGKCLPLNPFFFFFFFKAANVQSAVSLPGPGTAEQNEAGPFVIEWIPDLLPRCQMGELRITFEFGHEKSGQSDPCEKTNGTEKVGRKKSDSNQSKPAKTVEILTVVV